MGACPPHLACYRQDAKKADCEVGRELIEALLDTQADNVKHSQWGKKGILPKDVAERIKDRKAHAVFFHTVEKRWKFTSPAHRRAALRQLPPVP